MAKPFFALFGLGLLWLAIKVGFVATISRALIAQAAPHGEANAGVIYKRLEAERIAKHKPVEKSK